MNVDYLIVGQGIAGTLLSWFLKQEGKSFVVIDDNAETTSSKVAAGVINPVTGRRYHTTWKADELHPFAKKTYEEIGAFFNTQYIFQRDIVEFFPNPQAREVFIGKVQEGNPYMSAYPDQNRFNTQVRYDFGCGCIAPAYTTSLSLLMADMRRWIADNQILIEAPFDPAALQLQDGGVQYENITAQKAIFCEGWTGSENPWFRLLPWAPNKGEVLIIECRELEHLHILKKGITLAPLPVEHTYWAGSSYAWDGFHDGPSEAFRNRTTAILDDMLQVPYKVLFHKAAVRPATVERRPFVGIHPHHPQLAIFNGLGTKGTSLGPYFAQQLVHQLTQATPITPEADVARFSRVLARG